MMSAKQLLGWSLPLVLCAVGAAAPMQQTASVDTVSASGEAHAGRPAEVKGVSVKRSAGGMDVEVKLSRSLTPKILKLTNPDRIVVDLPGAIPAVRQRNVSVNGDLVKAVRMARNQITPPVTRIVVDLTSATDYEIVQQNAGLVLHLTALQPVPAPAAETHTAESNSASSLTSMQTNASLQPHTATMLPAMQQPASGAATVTSSGRSSCSSNRYTGEPISLNLKEADVRDFFRLIHEISGLNVVLDPDVHGTLTIVLDDVPWDQALNIVLRNNQLDCELAGNVLRIASSDTLRKEADGRRAAIEAQQQSVEKITVVRYLSYANVNELRATLQQFLSPRGTIVLDKRTNSLIISDIPVVIPAVDRQIKELDRKTTEVEIEARVVSTSRSFSRDIGTQFGFGFGNGVTGVSGNPNAAALSPIHDNAILKPFYPTTGNQIPLFSNHPAAGGGIDGLSFLNATNNYRIDFLLSMLESRGLAKILSRPRVVTQNNTPATIRQGTQVPIVTAAQLGGPPTTTYINAFLRLQVTPQITAEGTIFMNIDVENTTPDFANQVGGNPELDTQQATTQVLVSNGGTVMIGGVLQTQSSVTQDEVPLLGTIPLLGNLFKHKAVSTKTNELIFFITPRIITT